MSVGLIPSKHTLNARQGFTLIEMAVVLAIIGILSSVAISLFFNTEGADADLVRSVQAQLESGASQAAMLTGDPPNDTANLVTLATYIEGQMDPAADVTLNCGAGGGVCTLTFKTKGAGFLVGLNGVVQVTSLTGFSHFGLAGGQIIPL